MCDAHSSVGESHKSVAQKQGNRPCGIRRLVRTTEQQTELIHAKGPPSNRQEIQRSTFIPSQSLHPIRYVIQDGLR
jgi:hypothetical protein